MLTVWCVCVGSGYKHDYVQKLASMVNRNLTLPYKFKCMSDQHIDGIETVTPPTDLPGWWAKLGLFYPGFADTHNLYLDLDVVVTGSLDELVDRYADCALATSWNWAQSGHGGCQSSVMLWHSIGPTEIYQTFNHDDAVWPPRNDTYWSNGQVKWGDQEWITYCRDVDKFPVTEIEKGLVCSYKYHCRQQGKPTDNARVVVFHGLPNPAECSESWIREAWQ